ncbi:MULTISPECIES: TetR/AcrR family transcriptional regulator [unclassified Streptomyces]|uniref:TetR/AcrR family transcriptional regulator n=1 Tax=unclassified Streptomyces TaxID=2593676 RepID=UPI0038261A23
MGRVSKAQAEGNRAGVVAVAARLFRERGVQGVSVVDLMKSAGLTHGGFYKQFASKDALVTEAAALAFADRDAYLAGLDERRADRAGARRALVEEYLSQEHRDSPGAGCPSAGFSGDLARAAHEGHVSSQQVYADGVGRFVDWMTEDGDDGLVATCTLVGAILLARATSSTGMSDEILQAALASLAQSLDRDRLPGGHSSEAAAPARGEA